MQNKQLSKSIRRKLIHINTRLNTESDIYLYKEYLIKLYNYKVDINNKKKILEKLNTINIEGCVIPEYALFNGKDLIGVQMEYLYDYDALYDLLSIKNIDYNIRKNIAIKICQIILEIEKK